MTADVLQRPILFVDDEPQVRGRECCVRRPGPERKWAH
jgi:hypothetical protein